jgi:hypothetical protein
MIKDLATVLVTYLFYCQYNSIFILKLFSIIGSILVIKFSPQLNSLTRIFLTVIFTWSIADILDNAIGEIKKNKKLVYKNAHPEGDSSSMVSGVGKPSDEISRECQEVA